MKEEGRGFVAIILMALGVFIGLKLSTPSTASSNHLPTVTSTSTVIYTKIFHALSVQAYEAALLLTLMILIIMVCVAVSMLKERLIK
jgi:hypothetical protein